MAIQCGEVRSRIYSYIDPEERNMMPHDLAKHLEHCGGCSAAMESAVALAHQMSRLGEAQPPAWLKGELLNMAARQSTQCERTGSMLSAHLDGQLSRGDRSAVNRHLGACPHCARELAALRAMVSGARDIVSVTPPAHLRRRILDEVARRGGRQPAPQAFRGLLATLFPVRRTLAYAVGAATVAAIALTGAYRLTPTVPTANAPTVQHPSAAVAGQPRRRTEQPLKTEVVATSRDLIPVQLDFRVTPVTEPLRIALRTKLPPLPRSLGNAKKMASRNSLLDTTSEIPSYQPDGSSDAGMDSRDTDSSTVTASVNAIDEDGVAEVRQKSFATAVAMLKTKNDVEELAKQARLAAGEQREFQKPIEVTLIGFKF